MNIDSIGAENFSSVEDVNKAIQKLKSLRQSFYQRHDDVNGQKSPDENDSGCSEESATNVSYNAKNDAIIDFVCDLDEIDVHNLKFSSSHDWLWSSGTQDSSSVEELIEDRSYLDVPLLNVQFFLLNKVKGIIFEECTMKKLRETMPATTRTPISMHLAEGSSGTTPGIFEVSKGPMVSVLGAPSSENTPYSSNSQRAVTPGASVTTQFMSPLRASPIKIHSPYRTDPNLSNESLDEMDPIPSTNLLNNKYYVATPPRAIDTRTYTRPKKSRTPLGNTNSPGNFSTITKEDIVRGSSFPEANINTNLNETFTQDGSSPEDGSRTKRVSRNNSYVIRKEGDQLQDMNSTFTRSPEETTSPVDGSNNTHNISVEELHVIARLQEQSLKCVSPGRVIPTKTTSNQELPPARRPSRTSSSDTYCVAQSNSESPESSGLSSPMDSQSCDDITGANDSRLSKLSLPNLSTEVRNSSKVYSGLSVASAVPGLKYKPHHISDSKLSRSSVGSRIQGSSSKTFNNNSGHGMRDHSSKELRMSNSNSSISRGRTTSQPLGDHGASKPLNVGRIGVPRPTSFLPAPGFTQTSTGRSLQSRIPAPGSTRPRLARPSTTGSTRTSMSSAKNESREGCY